MKVFVKIASMRKKIIFIALVLLILIGSGFYLYKNKNLSIQGQSLDENTPVNIVNIGGVSIEGDGDIKIEPIEIKNNKPIINVPLPNLDRKVNFSTASENAKAKIEEILKALKVDTKNILLWIDLGLWRKAINDYEGAIEAWEYVASIAPQNSIALNNLGDLYGYYLKNAPKAEGYFLRAIRNEPNNVYLYFKTAEFYRDIAKDNAKVRAILQKGVAANPGHTSQDLQTFLNSF